MPDMIGGGGRQRTPGARRFPARTLHMVDIENLAGAALPSLRQVQDVRARCLSRLGLGYFDHVVIASSHLTLMNAALGWPRCRYRVRSGPDGADLELLDVLMSENVAARFGQVIIGSGDRIFATAAAKLVSEGVWVTALSQRSRLSSRLRMAACEVMYFDDPEPTAGSGSQLPDEAA